MHHPFILNDPKYPHTTHFCLAAASFNGIQLLIAFHSVAPPSAQFTNNLRAKQLSLSSTFTKLPKLTIKRRPRCRGPAGASMLDTAAQSYASALAAVAKSNGTLDHTAANIEHIDKFFSDAGVSYFFTNPLIDDSKREIIDQIVASLNLQPHVSNFLNILVDMKRMDIINDIVKEFEKAYNCHKSQEES